jgi:hypothetical protein
VAPIRWGSVVLPLQARSRLALRNRFPAPLGDAHFYYFRPPAGATRVSVVAGARRGSVVSPGLKYCGSVQVAGEGLVPAELNSALLWAYDPSRPAGFESSLTPLPLDQHRLLTGIPAAGARARRLRRFALPASPTGIYAVSVQGSGDYRLKLAFE